MTRLLQLQRDVQLALALVARNVPRGIQGETGGNTALRALCFAAAHIPGSDWSAFTAGSGLCSRSAAQSHLSHAVRSVWRQAHSTAAAPVPDAAEEDKEAPVRLTDGAVARIHELVDGAASEQERVLRLQVEAGGCSGFSYRFDLDAGPSGDDRVFEDRGAVLVVDGVSYEFVRGATVDFVDELIKSTFEVVQNPNTASSCGCGSSFAPKE